MNDDTNLDSDDTPQIPDQNIKWSKENELILVEWCDIAQCYKWLNMRAHSKYARLHAWFTIPAITMSTISGTASFAQSNLPVEYQAYAPMVIGSINILIGIISTIQQYLKISELNEAHRVSSIAWDKYARNIRIELAKRPEERINASIFIKHSRDEIDRLMETSPGIKDNVIKEFKNNFSGKEGTEKRTRYEQLRKPDICDTIISANETRHKWYLELNDSAEVLVKQQEKLIKQQSMKLLERESELRITEELSRSKVATNLEKNKRLNLLADEAVMKSAAKLKDITTYIISFKNIYERPPSADEIRTNFVDEIEEEILAKFFETYTEDDDDDDNNTSIMGSIII